MAIAFTYKEPLGEIDAALGSISAGNQATFHEHYRMPGHRNFPISIEQPTIHAICQIIPEAGDLYALFLCVNQVLKGVPQNNIHY